jgi:hypothetical protein
MHSTSPGPLEGDGEEFFLDILFLRMSAMEMLRELRGWSRQQTMLDKVLSIAHPTPIAPR